VKGLFTFIFGFIAGYLTFAFLTGGADEVATQVAWGVSKLQEGFDAVILWIQQYTPDQNPVE